MKSSDLLLYGGLAVVGYLVYNMFIQSNKTISEGEKTANRTLDTIDNISQYGQDSISAMNEKIRYMNAYLDDLLHGRAISTISDTTQAGWRQKETDAINRRNASNQFLSHFTYNNPPSFDFSQIPTQTTPTVTNPFNASLTTLLFGNIPKGTPLGTTVIPDSSFTITPISNSTTINSKGQLVQASQYQSGRGDYITTFTPSGKKIKTYKPSYASAGTDPLMRVVKEIGGGSHLAFTRNTSGNGSSLATKQASAVYLASYDSSYKNTDAYKSIMGL